jgi:serine protease inhibitor
MRWKSDAETPFVMNVQRPFFFAVRDRLTGEVLFMGAVNDPRGK